MLLRAKLPPLPYQAVQWSAKNRLQSPSQSFPNVQVNSPSSTSIYAVLVDGINSLKPSENAIYSKICALRKGDITTNSSFDAPS